MAVHRARLTAIELVDTESGVFVERKTRTPHVFDGKGYTLESHGDVLEGYMLGLSANEWDVLSWLRCNGGARKPVPIVPAKLAPRVYSVPATVKASVARLVKLGLVLRVGGPRSGMYQINPRRAWEGSGESHVKACIEMEPQTIKPDARTAAVALKSALKTAESAQSAAAVAEETAAAMPGTKLAKAAAAAAEEAHSSAVVAAKAAAAVGAKLPLHISRLAKEEDR